MKRIFKNVSYNFLIKIVSYVFSFITVIYVARVLKPVSYGKVSFAASIAGYFVLFANLGMPIYAMRTCAGKRDDRQSLSKSFNELFSISIILSVISIAALATIGAVIPKLKENYILLLIYGSAILFQMVGCDWLYRGLEEFRFLALSSLVFKLISLICILIFVRSEEHMIIFAALSVLASGGSGIICFFFLHKHVDVSFRFKINKEHFKPLLVFFMMSCAVYVYSSLDLTMLGFMETDDALGLYSLAAKGKAALTLIGGLVWSSALPMATNLWEEGKKSRFYSLASKCFVVVCSIQLCVTIVCLIFAKTIIFIAGGENYLGAVPSFRILLLSLFPIGASNILGGQVLVPAGKEKCLLKAEITGAVFNFFANLILIPYLSIVGAAITTTISEIIVWILCAYYAKKELNLDFGPVLIKRAYRKGILLLKKYHAILLNRIKKDNLPYYCPCCKTHLRRFINAGFDKNPRFYNPERYADTDQKVICPVCRALPRHRILVSWMDENKDRLQDKRILYFAYEKSVGIWMKRNGISVTTADLYNDADLSLNIEDTGLEEGAYDVVVCNHVLEHVDDFRKAIREMYRILSPGGIFLCSFPMDPKVELLDEENEPLSSEEQIRRFGQFDHKRVFGMKADRFLSEAGFEVEPIRGEDYPDEIFPVVGPADYDMNILFCCRKPNQN